MKNDDWIVKAVVTGFIIVLVAWYFQNGISSRPIVGYRFTECPKEINFGNWENKKQQSVGLGITNSGNTDASVLLHFHGENIDILNETKKPYVAINGTDVYVTFAVSKNTNEYYYGERVYFAINKNVNSFSYKYEVIKNPDQSISGSIDRFFGEIKGYYPIICSYKKETDEKFVYVS